MQLSLTAPLKPPEVDVFAPDLNALSLKQRPLTPGSAERKMRRKPALGVDHPMARNHARQRIFVQSVADSSRCSAVACQSGDLPVGRDAPARNLLHGGVDFIVEGVSLLWFHRAYALPPPTAFLCPRAGSARLSRQRSPLLQCHFPSLFLQR